MLKWLQEKKDVVVGALILTPMVSAVVFSAIKELAGWSNQMYGAWVITITLPVVILALIAIYLIPEPKKFQGC